MATSPRGPTAIRAWRSASSRCRGLRPQKKVHRTDFSGCARPAPKPDAFGRPRAARVGAANYIAGVSYHPNGLIAGASYLNGQALSQSLDARQKPRELKTAKVGGATAVWLTYAYDIRGKVSSATDTVSAAENRSYAYDANGRLLTASGPWGAGSYLYDALGNLRGWTQGATTAAKCAGKHLNGQCAVDLAITIREEKLDQLTLDALMNRLLTPERAQAIVAAVAKRRESKRGDSGHALGQLRGQLGQTNKRIRNLLDAVADGGVKDGDLF